MPHEQNLQVRIVAQALRMSAQYANCRIVKQRRPALKEHCIVLVVPQRRPHILAYSNVSCRRRG